MCFDDMNDEVPGRRSQTRHEQFYAQMAFSPQSVSSFFTSLVSFPCDPRVNMAWSTW